GAVLACITLAPGEAGEGLSIVNPVPVTLSEGGGPGIVQEVDQWDGCAVFVVPPGSYHVEARGEGYVERAQAIVEVAAERWTLVGFELHRTPEWTAVPFPEEGPRPWMAVVELATPPG